MIRQADRQGVAGGSGGTVAWDGPLPAPDIRDLSELESVLAVPGCAVTGPGYYMYRDIARTPEDRSWLTDAALRFDITVIPPRDLCGEYVKTKGHYHPENPAGTGYPEIYEVLAGEAHYLIQTRDLSDVAVIAAGTGDIVVIPPGYGHVTINPSRTAVLQMANRVSRSFQSEYGPFEELHGAAYYEMAGGEFTRNRHYPDVPAPRFVKAGDLPVRKILPAPLYTMVDERADVLGFLNTPEKYRTLFSGAFP